MSNPIFSIIAIFASLGFGFFYIKPAYDTMSQRQGDLATLSETLQSTKEIQSLIDKTGKTLDSLDPATLARFAVFLPETTDPIRLANNIQRMGMLHGIFLGKISVENATKSSTSVGGQSVNTAPAKTVAGQKGAAIAEAKYVTAKTTFSFAATDEAFRAFLGDLEKNLGLMNVTALTFSPVPESSDGQKVKRLYVPQSQYTIEIETYSLK